ncbi:MAG TPA: hypothetical protein PLB62_07055 [Candidatus Sumerlaeota bacterium]|nr:hypothetical protein [Candidatus Sumerlaeota bacterium]
MLSRSHYNTIIFLMCLALVPYLIISYNQLCEDSFITYRYVENFVNGLGLVFNPGERVEGYSNFLWVIILAVFKTFGISCLAISKIAGLVSTVLLLWIGSYYSLKKNQKKIDWIYFATPIMIFFNPMLHYHAGRGLETSFYALMLVWAAFSFKRRNYANSSIAFAALTLTRPEGFIYFFLLVPMLFLDIKKSNTEMHPYPVNHIRLRFFGPFFAILIPFIIWRIAYYGDVFPNTFYAKTEPLKFWRYPSLHSLLQFVISWSYIPLFAALSIFTYKKEKWELQRSLLIPMILAGGILAFTLAVGQVQASPFRHYAPLVPLMILLFQEVLNALKRRVEDNLPLIIALFVIFQCMNFYTSNNLDSPRTRLHSRTIEFIKSWNFPERVRWYFEPPIIINAETGRWCDRNLPEDAYIAADQVGQFAYYSNRKILDILGLNDREFGRKGYSGELLLERNPRPDYLVLMGFLGDNKPYLAPIAHSFEKPEFTERYRLRWIIRPNNTINKTEFLIYVRRDLVPDVPGEPEIIHVGPDTETWNRKLRVI